MGDVLDGTSEPRGGSVRWEGDTLVVSRPGHIDLRLDKSIVDLVRNAPRQSLGLAPGQYRFYIQAQMAKDVVIETPDGRVLKSDGYNWRPQHGFELAEGEGLSATGYVLEVPDV